MRVRYFIIILITSTSLSLTYTWQQVEIIRLAYQEDQRSKVCKELLDKNHYLRYNLLSLKSSQNLGGRLFNGNTDFEIPKSNQTLFIPLPKEENTIRTQDIFIKDGIILSMFKIKEAWPISLLKAYIDKHAQAEDLLKK